MYTLTMLPRSDVTEWYCDISVCILQGASVTPLSAALNAHHKFGLLIVYGIQTIYAVNVMFRAI